MSQLHKFRFNPIDELGRGKVTIDDKSIQCRGYELRHYVDEVPSVEIEIACVPQIEETATISVSNKEEIAALMDKSEFEEFCKIWEKMHDYENKQNSNIKFDICETNPDCEENPYECNHTIKNVSHEYSFICGAGRCKYCK